MATLEIGLSFVLVSKILLPSLVASLTHILSGGKWVLGRRGGEGGGRRGGGVVGGGGGLGRGHSLPKSNRRDVFCPGVF